MDELVRTKARQLEQELEQVKAEKRAAESSREDSDGAFKAVRKFRENVQTAVGETEQELARRLDRVKGAKFRRRFAEQHRSILHGTEIAAAMSAADEGAGDAERQRGKYDDQIRNCDYRIRQLEEQLYQVRLDIGQAEAEE